jgi:hypothetical protein
MTIALSVVATIINVVRMESMTCFMGGTAAGNSNQPKHNAFARKAEFGEAPSTASPSCQDVDEEKTRKKLGPKQEFLSQAGPIVCDHDRIAGI